MSHADPKTSELVDRLTSIAAACHDSAQLRERIAGALFPVVDQMNDAIQALKVENERLRSLTPNSGEPFGIWHPSEDPDECEFFLYSKSGAVSCPNCILLFTHPAPSTKPTADRIADAGKTIGWQPIETAPKDGRPILLFGDGRVTSGHWSAPSETPRIIYQDGFAPDTEWDEWEPYWASWDGGFTEEHPPTHWMPLPAAPQQGETK